MRVRIINWQSMARNWRKLVLVSGMAGLTVAAFCCGRNVAPRAMAAPPPAAGPNEVPTPALAPDSHSDYSRRIVAYIYGTIPITREDLGEYLIARYGADKLELLVNRKIIEHICKEKGVEVTAAEVEASVQEAMNGLGPKIQRKDFEKQVLKPRNLTFYEWKEDVIRPKLMMTKLCQQRVQVTDDDVKTAYEAYYGEKVDCKIIMWPVSEKKQVLATIYGLIRSSDAEFDRVATAQASPTLAARGGHIDPVGRNTTGCAELEKAAFSLRPGEISHVIETPEGLVVVKCLARIPATNSKPLADVRAALEKEIIDKKTQAEFAVVFREMKQQAEPKLLIRNFNSEEELLREAEKEIKSFTAAPGKSAPRPPQGN